MTTAISQAFASDQGAHTAAAALANTLVVKDRREMIVEEAPPPPYTTAELLRDANQRWGWPVERVMEAAQVLFESGWITYPRTDSTRLSPQARDSLRHTVLATYGPNALPNDQKIGPVKESFLQALVGKRSPTTKEPKKENATSKTPMKPFALPIPPGAGRG